MVNAEEVVTRMAIALGCANDSELARTLGRPRGTIGNWRARNSVPLDECMRIAEEKRVTLDWLLTGAEPKFRADVRADLLTRAAQNLKALEEHLDGLVMLADTGGDEETARHADAVFAAALDMYGALGPEAPPITGEEMALIELYRALSQAHRQLARQTLAAWSGVPMPESLAPTPPPQAPSPPLDVELLTKVQVEVDRVVAEERPRPLPPAVRAKVISIVYNVAIHEPEWKRAGELVKDYLRAELKKHV